MKKTMKKLLAILTSAVVICGLFVVMPASADSNEILTVYWPATDNEDSATVTPHVADVVLDSDFDFGIDTGDGGTAFGDGDQIIVRIPDEFTTVWGDAGDEPTDISSEVTVSAVDGSTIANTTVVWNHNVNAIAAVSSAVGGLTYTADTAGEAGNLISIVIVDGSNCDMTADATGICTTVVGNTITVEADLDDLNGDDTDGDNVEWEDVEDSINGDTDAATLITISGTAAGDASAQTINLADGADAVGAEREILITLGTTSSVALDQGVNIDILSATVKTPAIEGQYGFSIRTVDPVNGVENTGLAILSVGDGTEITAVIQEALILITNNESIQLVVDPSVNEGRDFRDVSASQDLLIKTNASEYSIYAKLDNGCVGNATYEYNVLRVDLWAAGCDVDDLFIESSAKGAASVIGDLNENYFGIDTTGDGFADSALTSTNAQIGTSCTSDCPTNGNPNPLNAVSFAYELNVDYLTRSGTYVGKIIYTAVPTF